MQPCHTGGEFLTRGLTKPCIHRSSLARNWTRLRIRLAAPPTTFSHRSPPASEGCPSETLICPSTRVLDDRHLAMQRYGRSAEVCCRSPRWSSQVTKPSLTRETNQHRIEVEARNEKTCTVTSHRINIRKLSSVGLLSYWKVATVVGLVFSGLLTSESSCPPGLFSFCVVGPYP